MEDYHEKAAREAENQNIVYGLLENGKFKVLKPKGGYKIEPYNQSRREFESSTETIPLNQLELLCSASVEWSESLHKGFRFDNNALIVYGCYGFPENDAKIFGATHLGLIMHPTENLHTCFNTFVQYYRLKDKRD
ncbi:MAG: hypothetical protein PHH54_06805 [Candidatus Nanoarchaeia archaeon]|nr:hypothetical protein [Candidatus Nanoarchaeia archaeon]MDD5741665.1 hypothetical protein [Candidatus Nanoarchaeia archaeon]